MKLRLEANGADLFVFAEGNAAPKLHVTREGARILADLCCVAELRAAVAHFGEHGELPPEPPVWPGLSVSPSADGWTVWHRRSNGERILIALVAQEGGKWQCSMQYATCSRYYATTPQAAVDAARAWLAEHWGLST